MENIVLETLVGIEKKLGRIADALEKQNAGIESKSQLVVRAVKATLERDRQQRDQRESSQ